MLNMLIAPALTVSATAPEAVGRRYDEGSGPTFKERECRVV